MPQEISGRALLPAGNARGKSKVTIFSKHLQFVQGEELGKFAAHAGFDGVDITVRKGGHVEPSRVAEDLPVLVDIIRRHGLEVPIVTTDIVDADTPFAEDVVRTVGRLGIRNYRWIGFRYDMERPLAAQLDSLKARVARLAALNARYEACALYHTESGVGQVGATAGAVYLLLKDFDPRLLGVNYDAAHATIEGGLGGWMNSFQILRPWIRGVAVKDFVWSKNAQGAWHAEWMPLNEGMVRLPELFAMAAASKFQGPLQLHFEYLPGNGKKTIPITREEVLVAMKRDLDKLKAHLAQAGL